MKNNEVIIEKSEFDLSKPIKGAFINKLGEVRVSLIDKFAKAGKKRSIKKFKQ
jgi:hypothetical protein